MGATDLLRAILPTAARRFLRSAHRELVLSRAVRRLVLDPRAVAGGSSAEISRLIYGWGNASYSALDEYITACASSALAATGPILECGSGLTTLILGAVAQHTGNKVWSLEHDRDWARLVEQRLRRYRIHAAAVCLSPLRDYGEFTWYTPPLERMPGSFSLVVCDGPPGTIRGGRYGLLPVMKSKFSPACRILLDDASREGEQAVAARWSEELGIAGEVKGSTKPFYELIVN